MFSHPSSSIREALGGIELRLLPKHRFNQRLAQVFDAAQQLKKELESFSNQLKEKKEAIPQEIWKALNVQRGDLNLRYRAIMDAIVQIGANKPHERVARMWFAPSTKKRCQKLHSEIRDVKHTLTELITRLTILSATEKIKYELTRLASQDSRHAHNKHDLLDDESVSMRSAKVSRERLRSSLHDLFNYRDITTSESERNPTSPATSQEKSPKRSFKNSSTSSAQQQSSTQSASTTSPVLHSEQREDEQDLYFCSRLVHPVVPQSMFDITKPDSIEFQTKSRVLSASQQGGHFVALQGLPGTGKSALLHALKHDEDITAHFTEGVHWLPLRSGVAEIHDAIDCVAYLVSITGSKAEAKDIKEMSDIQAAVQRSSKHLSSKRMLLLLDKSWTEGNVGSALVFKLKPFVTSRSGTVIVFVSEDSEAIWDAHRISITPRDVLGEDTLYIFLNHAGFTKEELVEAETVEILRVLLLLCHGLPLALAIAGKTIANTTKCGMTRKEAMKLYLEQHDSIFDDDEMNIPCISDVIGDHVQAALQILEQMYDNNLPTGITFRDLFLALCVVDKGHNLPLEVLRQLWNLSPGIAHTVASLFNATGLTTLLMKHHQGVDELQIHDLVHEYICSELSLVDFTNYHMKLVKSYEAVLGDGEPLISDECRAWWTLNVRDEGYHNRNLIRHLYHSGFRSEMLKLVVHPKWILAQLDEVGADQVDNDIGFVTDFLTFNNSTDTQALEMTVEEYEEIGAAARVAAKTAGRKSKQVTFHFYDRLLAVNRVQGILSDYLQSFENKARDPCLRPVQPCLGSPKNQLRSIIRILSRPQCMVTLAGDNYVACGCIDGRIVMLDTRRKRIVGQWRGHSDAVTSMCRSLTGKVIVTSSSDMTIRVWDCASSEQIGEVVLPDDRQVASTAVTVDELFVIAGFHDGSLLVWDLETGDRVAEAFNVRSPSAFTTIDVLAGGDRMITSSEDGFIRMWKLETMANANEDLVLHLKEDKNWSAEPFSDAVDCLAIHHESQIFAAASNGLICVSDLRSGTTRSMCDTSGSFGKITGMCFDENGKHLVFGSDGRVVHILDVEKNMLTGKPLRGHTQGVCDVAFLSRGSVVISAAGDETVRIWNVENPRGSLTSPLHSGTVTSLALTEKGDVVVSASLDGSLRLWDVKTGTSIGKPLTGYREKISAVAVSNNGERVISGAYDGSIRLWRIDGETHESLSTFQAHSDWISSIDISPTGNRAVSASFDGSVRAWDLLKCDGNYVTLRGHKGKVRTVKISSDGERIISVSRHEVRVWDLLHSTCIRRFEQENIGLKRTVSILRFAEEDTEEAYPHPPIQCKGFQVRYGKEVLATLPSSIECYEYSRANSTICAGLLNGQMVFLRLTL
ncbi:WD40-repeat containing protein [Gracilaria domingensis]|nr:WD40-repeat containing protein [Gracilaria domingensis]